MGEHSIDVIIVLSTNGDHSSSRFCSDGWLFHVFLNRHSIIFASNSPYRSLVCRSHLILSQNLAAFMTKTACILDALLYAEMIRTTRDG